MYRSSYTRTHIRKYISTVPAFSYVSNFIWKNKCEVSLDFLYALCSFQLLLCYNGRWSNFILCSNNKNKGRGRFQVSLLMTCGQWGCYRKFVNNRCVTVRDKTKITRRQIFSCFCEVIIVPGIGSSSYSIIKHTV